MENNKEIMDMLKVILEKVERLENIKTENVNISSGSITIQCGDASAVDIDNADDVVITLGKGPVSVEHAEEVTLHATEAKVECNTSIDEK